MELVRGNLTILKMCVFSVREASIPQNGELQTIARASGARQVRLLAVLDLRLATAALWAHIIVFEVPRLAMDALIT